MKNSKKDFGFAGQSTTEAKKPQKHDANLQKNSTLYFQIGLILCLLGTYALFEMQFQEKKINIIEDDIAQVDPVLIDYVPPFIEEVIKPKAPEPTPSIEIIDKVKVVKNDHPEIKTIIKAPDEPVVSTQPAKIGDIDVIEEPTDLEPIPFVAIEKVPVYPGCEKYTTNNKRKKCMSERITKLINNKFNTNIGYKYGLSGRQRIHTQFTIDKNGNITDIKIKGPHSALEKEANRVINKIPKMQPGLQREEPVGVIYTLPIMFEIRN
ncbi:energy transducer TonB [uncultured Winogradskyella sp.]|uniref:energy transducer TonB n=1 Tax=uncultured Winogradskyella sp. TaxID=395353 RepID=UPI00262D2C5A|nr:energy transducer TonB [uncultured Winogradskyella sp.]|tara:strand:- start:4159 stop:4953 length:795 start_codon:yes stop_codon:yes gene_type:complete